MNTKESPRFARALCYPTMSQAISAKSNGDPELDQGYRAEMWPPQCRQRPRSATHDTTGTSSIGPSSAPHAVQCDGGCTIDSPLGTRHSTTLRNDRCRPRRQRRAER